MLGRAEVYGQRLAVSDVEIAVGFGREAGVHLHAVAALSLRKILLYKGLNKVSGSDFFHLSVTPVKKYCVIINDSGRKYKKKKRVK